MQTERDVTGLRHHPMVMPITIDGVRPRDLVSARARSEEVRPMHVRSVPQLRAFSQHVAMSKTTREFAMMADPGLGKSTVFPLLLAKMTGKIVILVEFCGSLAECISEGLKRTRDDRPEFSGVAVTWYSYHQTGPELADLSGPHVVVISARKLMGRIALGRACPPSIVVHDESHYSDYAAYTWRSVGASYPWAEKLVSLSATLTPSIVSVDTAMDGVKYDKRVEEIPIPSVAEWSFDDSVGPNRAPWTFEALRDMKTLVFSDDMQANRRYGDLLKSKGVIVYHLYLGFTPSHVKEVRRATYTASGTVVLFADSAYRNGYNFDLDVVIDCGRVREEFIEGNRVLERYRLANWTEIQQGTARVGRSKPGRVYRNKLDYPTHVPILSLGEVRHAAALHVLLGFTPPTVLVELVPEVAGWNVNEALRIIKCTLDDVVEVITAIDSSRPAATSVSGEETPAAVVSDGAPVTSEGTVKLDDLLDRVQSMALETPHVDDVFTLRHPGARYEIPTSYYRVPAPYWVRATDARRMLMKMLADDAKMHVTMLTVDEVQWFAACMVEEWNVTAETVVRRVEGLTAVDEVSAYRLMHAQGWGVLRRTHGEVALALRELDVVMDLMRRLYVLKPFTVRLASESTDSVAPSGGVATRANIDDFVAGRLVTTPRDRPRIAEFGLHDKSDSVTATRMGWAVRPNLNKSRARITTGSETSGSISTNSK